MILFTHSETLTVLPSNFGNGQVIYFQQAHGWGTPFRREVYRCDFCDGFVLTFVTVSMRPRQTAAIHQLKMVTVVTGIKKM